jgi:hypothetical protein
VVHATLKNTAAVAVSGNLDAVGGDGVVDELVVFRSQLVEALLDDVVAVQILDEHNNVETKRDDDRVDLTTSGQEVDHLLDSASTVHVERDVD